MLPCTSRCLHHHKFSKLSLSFQLQSYIKALTYRCSSYFHSTTTSRLSHFNIFYSPTMPIPLIHNTSPTFAQKESFKTTSELQKYDPEQVRLMDEMCIVVDSNDQILGYDTKFNTHRWENIQTSNILHRAFSVFLFNEKYELLLQQRSKEKITFPGYWTNTCCSHPLFVSSETNGVQGCQTAGLRKLIHELGIQNAPPLLYLTRIHYRALSDATWGEHEIDYIFFGQGKFEVNRQPNEVLDTKFVNEESLKKLLRFANSHPNEVKITPWFKMICENFLFEWWSHLRKGSIETCVKTDKIFKLS